MTFKDTWAELEKLQEWYCKVPQSSTETSSIGNFSKKTGNILTTQDFEDAQPKRYEVSYYDTDGVRKSFIVVAHSKSEATALAWEKVDADDIRVSEI